MPSEQDNQTDPAEPQTPQTNELADEVVGSPEDQQTTAMPGDAAEEPVDPQTVSAEPSAPITVADAHAELPDGAVEPVDEDEAADEPLVTDPANLGLDVPTLEALLFSTHHPLTGGRLAELLDVPSTKPVRKAIRLLNESYAQSSRCFRIEQVAGGFQMLTLADYGPTVQVLHQREADSRLTKAALETLAIVAYKQPILRADVEAIRGVASGETIRSLMEKHLVKIGGRAELPGRPILYGTTKRFLEIFGLNSLRDLPQAENLPKVASRPAPPTLFVEPAPEEATPNESVTTLPPDNPSADADDQAAAESVQLTQQAAEQEAAMVDDLAEDAAAEDITQDQNASETVDEAQPAESADVADDADDGDDGSQTRPE